VALAYSAAISSVGMEITGRLMADIIYDACPSILREDMLDARPNQWKILILEGKQTLNDLFVTIAAETHFHVQISVV
jgi:hypothetical protein